MALGPGTSALTPTIVHPPRIPVRVATVRQQFDRRAAMSARDDALAREISRRLLERLDLIRLAPRRIVDIGCGAGGSRAALLKKYGEAAWIGVDHSLAMLRLGARAQRTMLTRWWRAARTHWLAADAAALPLADGCVDLAFSNLMLHWHPTPHLLFAEWKRVLATNGLLLFSCFGPDTLNELREAVAATLPHAAPMPFIDMHDFGDMMVAAGFATPVMDAEHVRLTYESPTALLRDVIAMGGNPRDDRWGGLVSSRQARALVDALEAQRGGDGRIALTFEVAYGHAWKPSVRTAGEVTISVERLRTQLHRR